jgi:hypothetical protein
MTNTRALRLLLPAVVLLAACSGSTTTKDTLSPVASSTTVLVQEEPDADLCEVGPSGENINCGEENLIVEESLEGAVARLIEEKTLDSDLRYLLLDETAYTQLLAPVLGEAELVSGGAMPVYGFYVPALAEFTDLTSWQQEWRLGSGTTLVEQVVLLPTDAHAAKAFDVWKASALASGLSEVKGSTSPGFTTAYSNPGSMSPGRTCAVQSIVAVSRFLVSVTYLTGGDCKVVPSPLAATVLAGLVTRIDATFPG